MGTATGFFRRVVADSLLRNSLYIMTTTAVNSALGYLYWIVAARTYAATEVGLAAALIAAMTLASMLSNLGVASALVQTLPTRPDGGLWSRTLTAGFATGLVVALVATVITLVVLTAFSAELAITTESGAYLVTFTGGVLLLATSILLDYTFLAERAAGKMLARNAVFAALKVPLLLVPALASRGALGILGSWVTATAVSAVAGIVLVRRLRWGYRPVVRGIVGDARTMSRAVVGNHFINLGGVMPMYLLPIAVATRLSPTENAYFYATWMVGNVFFMVSGAVASSLFAEGSHAPGEIARKTRSAALIIAALLAPAVLVLLLAGEDVMRVFGATYAREAFPLLTLLIASAVPEAITNVYVTVLRVQRRWRHAAAFTLSTAAVALVVAWILLPVVGIAGAGWGWLVAQVAASAVAVAHALARRWQRARPRSVHGTPRALPVIVSKRGR